MYRYEFIDSLSLKISKERNELIFVRFHYLHWNKRRQLNKYEFSINYERILQ